MVAYLIKRLLGVWLPLIPIMAIGSVPYGASPLGLLGSVVFWSGLVAAIYIYFVFRRKGLWPLYDNLRLPKLAILIGFVCTTSFVSFIVALLS
jgi:hypothetical protein